jgi:hypothetical protein
MQINMEGMVMRAKTLQAFLAVFVLLTTHTVAHGSAFTDTVVRDANGTVTGVNINITGSVYPQQPETFTITYTDNATGKVTTVTRSSNQFGMAYVAISPKSKTTITTTNTSETITNPAVIAEVFQPGENYVASNFVFQTGSSIDFNGSIMALSGGFTATQTNVDYNPSSPTYGVETGFLSNINMQATGDGQTVQFLNIASPITLTDLSGAWLQFMNLQVPTDISIPTTYSFTGQLLLDSVLSPFSAIFDGTTTFLTDGSTLDSGTLVLDTNFGRMTGSLIATATPQLIPTPEPSAMIMVGLGFMYMTSVFMMRKKSS